MVCGGSIAGSHQAVDADVDVAVFELDRRSVRPDLQLGQILDRHVLDRTNPLPRDQKPSILRRDDLDGIAVGHIPNRMCAKFVRRFCLPDGERRGVFRIANLLKPPTHFPLSSRPEGPHRAAPPRRRVATSGA